VKAFVRRVRAKGRKALLADLASVCRKEVEAAMDDRIKPALVKSHEKIVEDWESDVAFAARKVIKPDSITIYVYPTGEDKMVWVYVDQGTRPHEIRARNAPRLAFWAGTYEPKTLARPARTVSGGGYVKEPKVFVRPLVVQHPGIKEPREFSKRIVEDIEPYFVQEIEKAFQRAARKANGK
jgi:hypothetical protein